MGLTPYDKKSYKESKRRRRQALLADETGFIVPYRKKRRKALITALTAFAVLIVAAAGFFAYRFFFQSVVQVPYSQAELDNSKELLKIVNRQNPLESSFVPKLTDFDGFRVNVLAYDSLKAMTEKAEQEGIELKIISAYVSFEDQQQMYEYVLNQLLENPDYTEVRAEAAAERLVPQGGCSEAQTGFLIEFDVNDTEALSFLERNCVSYGFVLRYPENKDELTHTAPSSSLFRYVGADNSVKLRSYGMCLEEYVEYIETAGAK